MAVESGQRSRPLALVAPEAGFEDAHRSPSDRVRAAFREHHGAIFTTAHRILLDAAEAEDVTQSVFETLARRLDKVREDSRMRGFLQSCAIRQCLVILRRRRWWSGARAAKVAQREREPVDPGADAFVVAAVRELLDVLAPDERVIVVLELVEHHSHAEVAEIVGTSVATVRRRLDSARRKLLARAEGDVQRRLVDEIEVSP